MRGELEVFFSLCRGADDFSRTVCGGLFVRLSDSNLRYNAKKAEALTAFYAKQRHFSIIGRLATHSRGSLRRPNSMYNSHVRTRDTWQVHIRSQRSSFPENRQLSKWNFLANIPPLPLLILPTRLHLRLDCCWRDGMEKWLVRWMDGWLNDEKQLRWEWINWLIQSSNNNNSISKTAQKEKKLRIKKRDEWRTHPAASLCVECVLEKYLKKKIWNKKSENN